MTPYAVPIPDELAAWVPRVFGDPGRQWLAELPATAQGLADQWGLRLGPAYSGGSHALVLAVTREDGSPAALKVPMVDDENHAEPHALREYAGDGAVLLYAYDRPSGAMLLERAEPGTPLLAEARRDAAVDRALALWRRLRRPLVATAGEAYPRVADLVERWVAELPGRQRALRLPGLDGPLAEAVELARDYVARPAGPSLLINRDGHLSNILRAQREPWLLIDPKPLLGEAAFDGSFPVLKLLAGNATPVAAAAAVTRVAIGLGVDPARLRGWALLRAVDNALWTADMGDDPAPTLAVVRALCALAAEGHRSIR